MGGVRGDVLDITPLRTKVMEIGSPDAETWVHGRQFTGRVVALSNKLTFTEPVFNYSTLFEFIWEELTIPVPYDADWDLAKRILLEEVERRAPALATPRRRCSGPRRPALPDRSSRGRRSVSSSA